MSKELIKTTEEILAKAGFAGTASWEEGRISIRSPENISSLIDPFEHLIRLIAYRRLSKESLPDFILDINDYRKAHSEDLVRIARESAKRVMETGRAESLTPMNAFERKIVHTELAAYGNLQTQSIGTEPNRRVVIKRASL